MTTAPACPSCGAPLDPGEPEGPCPSCRAAGEGAVDRDLDLDARPGDGDRKEPLVFISHASPNAGAAEAVCAALEGEGIRCWIAPRDIHPGAKWAASLIEAVEASAALVLIYTPEADGSEHVLSEVNAAQNARVPILTFRVEDFEMSKEMRYFLGSRHWLDAFPDPVERHLPALVREVQGLVGDRAEEAAGPGAGAGETCPTCGAVLPPDAPGGLCPACLLREADTDRPAGRRPAPPSLAEIGALLPRYELLELVGRGGMGAVYKARQPSLDRPVAVKVLSADLSADPEFVERFRREALALARFTHPNLVTVYDFGEAGGLCYILMEFVEGHDLDALIRGEGWGPAEALRVFPQICAGLQFAHDAGTVHRDIKPSNILVDRSGRVKIADFGLAKLATDPGGGLSLTAEDGAMGTPYYVAPEQIRNPQGVDHRADIFSLGVLLYEMLTGELPAGAFKPPSALAPVGPGVDALVVRALDPDPARRQPSVGALAEEFAAAVGVEGEPGSLEGDPEEGRGAAPAGDRYHVAGSVRRQESVVLLTRMAEADQLQHRVSSGRFVKLLLRHDALFREVIDAVEGAEILQHLGDGFLAGFATPRDALEVALRFQAAASAEGGPGGRLEVSIGIHQGEVVQVQSSAGAGEMHVGLALQLLSRLAALAAPRQILLTRRIFDAARESAGDGAEGGSPVPGAGAVGDNLRWVAHGRYLLEGFEEPVEVFEVGRERDAPLCAPPDAGGATRSVSAEEEETLGWRPAAGLEIPRRQPWRIVEKLGEGGFGEVWLATHPSTKEKRVFKFCFDPGRLRSFKRELTFFRLLRDALGSRRDIARIYEIEVEAAPFFIESEYCPTGNLEGWAARGGGIGAVPLERRLSIVARTARAAAAAHSVGIIHKDIKPSNILLAGGPDGAVNPILADFGIGVLADTAALQRHGITGTGFTDTVLADRGSSRTGTRLYAAPEYLVGRPPSIGGDIYALGVLLFQMVVGDLARPLGPGWERDVEDPLLREDIGLCVDVDPSRRLAAAADLADRLESLGARREDCERRREAQRLEARRRRRHQVLAAGSCAAAVLVVLATLFAVRERTLRGEAEEARNEQRREAEKAIRFSSAAEEARRKTESALDRFYGKATIIAYRDLISARAPSLRDYLESSRPTTGGPDRRGWEWYFLLSEAHRYERSVRAGQGPLNAVQFAPGGTVIASAGERPEIVLWDASSLGRKARLEGHHAGVSSLAWNGVDPGALASGSDDHSAIIWDVAGGEVRRRLFGHLGPVRAIAWHPDGTHLVTGGEDRRLILWDARSGVAAQTARLANAVLALAWSGDGRWLACGLEDGNTPGGLAVFRVGRRDDEIEKLELFRWFRTPDDMRSVAWDAAREGRVVAGATQRLLAWDVESGRELLAENVHHTAIYGLASHPARSWVATAGRDWVVKVVDVEQGRTREAFLGHDGAVAAAAWFPSGDRLITAGRDGMLRTWSPTPEHREGRVLCRVRNWISHLEWSPGGERLAVASWSRGVLIVDSETGHHLGALNGHRGSVVRVDWSPSGERIATASYDKKVKVWDAETLEELHELDHTESMASAWWSPDGSRLACGSWFWNTRSGADADKVTVWDVSGDEPRRDYVLGSTGAEDRRYDHVYQLDWHPSGAVFVTGGRFGAVKLWDSGGGRLLQTVDAGIDGDENQQAMQVKWSPDAGRVAAGRLDGRITVYSATSEGRELRDARDIPTGAGPLLNLDWTPDGGRIAASFATGLIVLYDAVSGNELLRLDHGETPLLEEEEAGRRNVFALSFSPCGRRLVSGGYDNVLKVWDATRGYAIDQEEAPVPEPAPPAPGTAVVGLLSWLWNHREEDPAPENLADLSPWVDRQLRAHPGDTFLTSARVVLEKELGRPAPLSPGEVESLLSAVEAPAYRHLRARLVAASGLPGADAETGGGESAEPEARPEVAQGAKPVPAAGQGAASHQPVDPAAVPRPGEPWENDLGIRFVPVAGIADVLFATTETRVSDYAEFVGGSAGSPPPRPSGKRGPDHPAENVSWADAVRFCDWLTDRDRSAGKLRPNQGYRLSTDGEWSRAAGQGQHGGGQAPQEKLRGGDGKAATVPTRSTPASGTGLHDLVGNVWEWTLDRSPEDPAKRTLRGAAWKEPAPAQPPAPGQLVRGRSARLSPWVRRPQVGFRLVLYLDSAAERPLPLEPALAAFHEGRPDWLAEAAWDDFVAAGGNAIIRAVVEKDAAGKMVGNLDRIDALLRVKPALLHFRQKTYGSTPLHFAAFNGVMDAARLLVERGADLNARAKGKWHTPLHDAVAGNRAEMVVFLLEKGARTQITDVKGRTPLAYAKEKGRAALVEILTRHGGGGG